MEMIKLTKYKFEIQNLITVEIEANNSEDARMKLIDSLDDYAEQMVDGSCYVSDGTEIKED